jgi:replicative DNA helicase
MDAGALDWTTTEGPIDVLLGEHRTILRVLDEVERDILRISEDRETTTIKPMKDLVLGAIDMIQEFHQRAGGLTGLPTGFADFDKMTSGMHGGEMIVIAARPSMGKTSLVMNIAEHIVINEKQPVGVFSLEMTSESLVMRMLCSLARVNGRSIREGFMAEQDFKKLTGAAAKMAAGEMVVGAPGGKRPRGGSTPSPRPPRTRAAVAGASGGSGGRG